MTEDSRLHELRVFLDEADDALARSLWLDSDGAQWSAITAQARRLADDSSAELVGDPTAQAVELAVGAVARAVLAHDDEAGPAVDRATGLRSAIVDAGRGLALLPRLVGLELRHVLMDRPRSLLIRLAITLAMAMGLVVGYQIAGWADYDARTLTIYLFSAVVGSVVCTNALCFDAPRVRTALIEHVPVWRILVVKNISIALLVVVAAMPVIVLLRRGAESVNAAVISDQLIAMLFIWLGVANVLSVVSPLRREPVTDRLYDGTWKPYLWSFVVSYGVGLTVNVMIYWRLWARQAAADQVTGGGVSAYLLVLVSSMLAWLMLTVVAVSLARRPIIRRILSRELSAARPQRRTKAQRSPAR